MNKESMEDVRKAIRTGEWEGPTAGLAPDFVQANLVILPQSLAADFLLFCTRNPKPCPLLEVTDPGDPVPRKTAPGADLRTDLPRYRIWRHGELVEERREIRDLWRKDAVAFLVGCSFSFESILLQSGVPVRHIEEGRNVPMYRTSIPCEPAGSFHGNLVVSMRPLPPQEAIRAVEITSRYPQVHGAPVHLGDSRRDRHQGSEPTGLRRCGYRPPGRAPGLLGLRRHPSGSGCRQPSRVDDHPRPGTYVHHRDETE